MNTDKNKTKGNAPGLVLANSNGDTEKQDGSTIEVRVGSSTTRGNVTHLKVEQLSVNVNLFLDQMGTLLEKTPQKVGQLEFAEFEVHAEITAKGTLSILGTGGEAGATGGIKFVFKRPGT